MGLLDIHQHVPFCGFRIPGLIIETIFERFLLGAKNAPHDAFGSSNSIIRIVTRLIDYNEFALTKVIYYVI